MNPNTKVFGIPVKKLAIHLVLIAGAAVMFIPFLWMVLSSFKSNGEIMKVPISFLPKKWVFLNYNKVFNGNFEIAFMNTTYIAVAIVFFQLVTGAMAAYAFALLKFPLKNLLFLIVLGLCMVPNYMLLIPRYRMLSAMKLSDTLVGVVLPNTISITVVFFLRQNFMSFPRELIDASMIDGAGYFRIFSQMVIPLNKSALTAMGIMVLLFAWNDLLWPNVIINSDNKTVLSIFIRKAGGMYKNEQGVQLAAAFLAILPMIIAYGFGQKSFLASIAMSGIKG